MLSVEVGMVVLNGAGIEILAGVLKVTVFVTGSVLVTGTDSVTPCDDCVEGTSVVYC